MDEYDTQLDVWQKRRRLALVQRERGTKWRVIAQQYGVSIPAVQSWVEKAKAERAQERRAATLRAKKLREEA